MFGQIEFDTPIYLVVYRLMGTTISGLPMYSIVKCYTCDFHDIDGLLQQHANNVGNAVQWIAFYREPANPFQGVTVDVTDPFTSPLAMEYPQVLAEVAAERERLRLLEEARYHEDKHPGNSSFEDHEMHHSSGSVWDM